MFKTHQIHHYEVYNLAEVGNIANRSEKTIREFIRNGLKTIDGQKPFLVRGYDLIEFLKRKNIQNQHHTNFNEMFCLKCREVRRPKANQIQIYNDGQTPFIKASAICPTCKTLMNKAYKLTDLSALKRDFHIVERLSISDSVECPVNCQIMDNRNDQENGTIQKEQLCMSI